MSTLLFGIQQDKVYLAPADSFALKGRNERDLEKVILSLKNEKRVQRVLLLGLLTEQNFNKNSPCLRVYTTQLGLFFRKAMEHYGLEAEESDY